MNKTHDIKAFEKKQFLMEQGLISSINAAVRHVGIYRKKAKKANKKEYDRQRDKLREDFAKAIIKAANKIKDAQNGREKIAVEAIEAVVEKLKNHKILKKGQPSFGVAQKAVNLFLKYLWCLNISKCPPPYCPIDRQILTEIKWDSRKNPEAAKNWSRFSKKDYEAAIKMVREKSKRYSIAEWELAEWESSLKTSEKQLCTLLV